MFQPPETRHTMQEVTPPGGMAARKARTRVGVDVRGDVAGRASTPHLPPGELRPKAILRLCHKVKRRRRYFWK